MGACCSSSSASFSSSDKPKDGYSDFGKSGPLDLIAFDFDKTITTIHLYFELAGDAETQLMKISDSDIITDDRLITIFGGQNRLNRLQTHLELLSANIEHVAIISFGFENVIRKALERVDLLKYFTNDLIIGNDTDLLRNNHKNKGFCLRELISKYDIKNKNNVLFVDDDNSNVRIVNDLGIANTLWIKERNGINEKQMSMIERKIGIDLVNNNKDTRSNKIFGDKLGENKDDVEDMMDEIIHQIKDDPSSS